MNDGLLTMLILGAESGAVILLIFIIVIFMLFRRRRADKAYVRDIIQDYKESKPKNDIDIKSRLEEGCYIAGEDADKVMTMITASEKTLLKRLLNLYLGNERHCLSDIQKDVEDLGNSWISVARESAANAMTTVSNDEAMNVLEGRISEMESENRKMSERLTEAMQTMEEIMVEYGRLYADKDEKDEKMEALSEKFDELKSKVD